MKIIIGVALACAGVHAAAAEPTVANLPDPRLAYRSAFENPLPVDAKPADWRDSNEQMRRLGGHAGHLRGAPRGEAPTPATAEAAPAVMPKSGPHLHHGGGRP